MNALNIRPKYFVLKYYKRRCAVHVKLPLVMAVMSLTLYIGLTTIVHVIYYGK